LSWQQPELAACRAQVKAARLLAEAEVVVYDDLGTEARPPRLCASGGARRPPVPALQTKHTQAESHSRGHDGAADGGPVRLRRRP